MVKETKYTEKESESTYNGPESTYKKGDVVKKEFLVKAKYVKNLSYDPHLSIVKYRGKKYLIERIGKCDYKKCKNVCCKFFHLGYCGSYALGFGKKNQTTKGVVIKKKCSRLGKNGKCSLFGKKRFPAACKQFPHPWDETYHVIYGKCSFRFKIIEEIKE